MVETWVIGALINLIGSIFINVGMNLMKHGFNMQVKKQQQRERELMRNAFSIRDGRHANSAYSLPSMSYYSPHPINGNGTNSISGSALSSHLAPMNGTAHSHAAANGGSECSNSSSNNPASHSDPTHARQANGDTGAASSHDGGSATGANTSSPHLHTVSLSSLSRVSGASQSSDSSQAALIPVAQPSFSLPSSNPHGNRNRTVQFQTQALEYPPHQSQAYYTALQPTVRTSSVAVMPNGHFSPQLRASNSHQPIRNRQTAALNQNQSSSTQSGHEISGTTANGNAVAMSNVVGSPGSPSMAASSPLWTSCCLVRLCSLFYKTFLYCPAVWHIFNLCCDHCVCCDLRRRFNEFAERGRYWFLGFLCFFIGNVTNFFSFGYAAQSLLACVGSVQFICQVVIGRAMYKHRLTWKLVAGTFVIVVGNILVVSFASHDSKIFSSSELQNLLFSEEFEIYCAVLVVMLVICHVTYHSARTRTAKLQQQLDALAYAGALTVSDNGDAVSVDSASANAQQQAREDVAKLQDWYVFLKFRVQPITYVCVSAIIGTQSAILAKSTSELLRTTIAGDNQFLSSFTWLILVCWVGTMIFWIKRMDSALKKFDHFVVPVLQVAWTLFSVLGGGIYFKEFTGFSVWEWAGFWLGVAIVIGGVYLVAPQPHHHRFSAADLPSDAESVHESLPDQLRHQQFYGAGISSRISASPGFSGTSNGHANALAINRLPLHSRLNLLASAERDRDRLLSYAAQRESSVNVSTNSESSGLQDADKGAVTINIYDGPTPLRKATSDSAAAALSAALNDSSSPLPPLTTPAASNVHASSPHAPLSAMSGVNGVVFPDGDEAIPSLYLPRAANSLGVGAASGSAVSVNGSRSASSSGSHRSANSASNLLIASPSVRSAFLSMSNPTSPLVQNRSRAMSLGFAMPLFDAMDDSDDDVEID